MATEQTEKSESWNDSCVPERFLSINLGSVLILYMLVDLFASETPVCNNMKMLISLLTVALLPLCSLFPIPKSLLKIICLISSADYSIIYLILF